MEQQREFSSIEQAIQTLEWDRLVDLACCEAQSELGRQQVDQLKENEAWAQSVSEAQLRQKQTQEVLPLLGRDALWRCLNSLPDPSPILESLALGRVIELEELASVRSWLIALDSWVQMPRHHVSGSLFQAGLDSLLDPSLLLRKVDRVLTPRGEISEKASPLLRSLLAEIRKTRSAIQKQMDVLMKKYSSLGVLQEEFSDVRSGQFVLPVRISSQSQVEGEICDTSVSRQTVYIEPREVGELGRQLRRHENALHQEIYRILRELCTELQPFSSDIERSVRVLGYWDAVQARARLGQRYGGKKITVSEGRTFHVTQAAHPLLWWAMEEEEIVRNDILLSEKDRTLLITGPNTGGKTVLLKTVGLAALCARTGFLFPAGVQVEVPYFDRIFADVGDPQSIEAHLSSFSGHVMTLNRITNEVTPMSLILLDELNSATDPEEGAALARAFLESIMEVGDGGHTGPITVATTHDRYLKSLAIQDSRIVNSSMAFNEGSNQPTYEMVYGVPGRSRALETAQRLGVSSHILERAHHYLSRGHQDFEGVLAELEVSLKDAKKSQQESQRLEERAKHLKEHWEEKTRIAIDELLGGVKSRLRRLLSQSQDEIRGHLKQLRESRSRQTAEEVRHSIHQSISRAMDDLDKVVVQESTELAELTQSKPEVGKASEGSFEVGQIIRVPKWKNLGTVTSIQKEKVEVILGDPRRGAGLQMKVLLKKDEISELSPAEKQQLSEYMTQKKKTGATVEMSVSAPSSSEVGSSLDLRGKRFEEAMTILENYIDASFRSGQRQVRVITGLGSGAIREGTRKYLASVPYVLSFEDGGEHGGGAGATLVEFDQSN